MAECVLSGQRLDPAHARGHARLGEDLEKPDLAGVGSVGASAELLAELADADHPDALAVFLLEDGHGPFRQALLQAHLPDHDGIVLPDALVDQGLHAGDLLGR